MQVVESSGLAPVGEVLLVPDLAAAVPAGGSQGDLMAPVDMMEKDLSECWHWGVGYTWILPPLGDTLAHISQRV